MAKEFGLTEYVDKLAQRVLGANLKPYCPDDLADFRDELGIAPDAIMIGGYAVIEYEDGSCELFNFKHYPAYWQEPPSSEYVSVMKFESSNKILNITSAVHEAIIRAITEDAEYVRMELTETAF